MNKIENTKKLLVIKTARTIEDINIAAKIGFKILIKKVEPSDEIRVKYCVLKNKNTGEVHNVGDLRSPLLSSKDYEIIIDWTYHYPYSFKTPYAAYLIPKHLKTGERVFIKDLIEDYAGARWNQGNVYRLESCEAIWNGADLIMQYNSDENCAVMIG